MKASNVGELSRNATYRVVLLLLAYCIPACAQQVGKAGPEHIASSKAAAHASPFLDPAAPWPPPDADREITPLSTNVPCSLHDVLEGAGERLTEFAENVTEFTATERVDHQQFRNNAWSPPKARAFEYLAELQEIYPGMLVSTETRNGSTGLEVFPAGLAHLGLPFLVLAFHPYFINDFNVSCEGLGQWHGKLAWELRFQQRPERTPRLRAFVVRNRYFPLKLKGRALISADTFQVLHVESDLLETVPEIRLVREHVVVDYEPVRFQQRGVELWLPQTAEVYMDFRGHRYRRRHMFSDYLLFSVDVHQRIAGPKPQ